MGVAAGNGAANREAAGRLDEVPPPRTMAGRWQGAAGETTPPIHGMTPGYSADSTCFMTTSR